MVNLLRHPVRGSNQNLTDTLQKITSEKDTRTLKCWKVHQEKKSFSTLKRYLKKVVIFSRLLLERRIKVNEVKEIVQKELCGSGSNLGDRRVVTFKYF